MSIKVHETLTETDHAFVKRIYARENVAYFRRFLAKQAPWLKEHPEQDDLEADLLLAAINQCLDPSNRAYHTTWDPELGQNFRSWFCEKLKGVISDRRKTFKNGCTHDSWRYSDTPVVEDFEDFDHTDESQHGAYVAEHMDNCIGELPVIQQRQAAVVPGTFAATWAEGDRADRPGAYVPRSGVEGEVVVRRYIEQLRETCTPDEQAVINAICVLSRQTTGRITAPMIAEYVPKTSAAIRAILKRLRAKLRLHGEQMQEEWWVPDFNRIVRAYRKRRRPPPPPVVESTGWYTPWPAHTSQAIQLWASRRVLLDCLYRCLATRSREALTPLDLTLWREEAGTWVPVSGPTDCDRHQDDNAGIVHAFVDQMPQQPAKREGLHNGEWVPSCAGVQTKRCDWPEGDWPEEGTCEDEDPLEDEGPVKGNIKPRPTQHSRPFFRLEPYTLATPHIWLDEKQLRTHF